MNEGRRLGVANWGPQPSFEWLALLIYWENVEICIFIWILSVLDIGHFLKITVWASIM